MRRQTTLDPPGQDQSRVTSVAFTARPLNGGTNNNSRRSKGTSSSSALPFSTRTSPISMIRTIFIILMIFWILSAITFYRNSITSRRSSPNADVLLPQPAIRHLVNEPAKRQIVSSPYDGWQPPDYVDKNADDCSSWRKCFTDNHSCPGRCRDSKLDLQDEASKPLDFDDTTWYVDLNEQGVVSGCLHIILFLLRHRAMLLTFYYFAPFLTGCQMLKCSTECSFKDMTVKAGHGRHPL